MFGLVMHGKGYLIIKSASCACEIQKSLCLNLQGFCTAGSPSWCGHWTHTGSSSASPVHLFSSSAHSSVWPDPCHPLPHPFCPACALAISPCLFYAWTWAKIIHNNSKYAGQHMIQTRHCHYCSTHFLRMGQSFMKWPILPQMRQQRSLGATSPSVSTSGSKKYSCSR